MSRHGLNSKEGVMSVTAGVAASLFVAYHIYLRNSDHPSKYIKFPKLPDNIKWLDQQTFEVFTAFCDTIVPSYTIQECNTNRITQAFDLINPRLKEFEETLTIEAVEKLKSYLCAGGTDFGTHKHCAEALERTATKAEKRQLYCVLKLLSTTIGTFILTGYPAPFQRLPLLVREKILQDLRDSCLEQKKMLFLTFKRLVAGVYLSYTERGTESPLWGPIEYFPKNAVKPIEKILNSPEQADNNLLKRWVNYRAVVTELNGSVAAGNVDTLQIDAVVIGSGCGGGIVAYELVMAGFNVLVLEKGGFFQTDDFARWRESEAFPHTFEKGGLCATSDGNIAVLAGSCVGGGSTVNWSASFKTPRHVLEEWQAMGLPQFNPDNGEFLDSLDYALRMKNVNTDNSYYDDEDSEAKSMNFVVNENNRLLWKGARNAGYVPEKIPRNVKDCVNCGHCTYGCSHKAKQSSWNAFLEPIVLSQAKQADDEECNLKVQRGKLYIIPDCCVDNVTYTNGGKKVASGVMATASIYSDQLPSAGLDRILITKRSLIVKAKIVVVAAGSIHTPAVLLRSKFKSNLIGKYLTLHPVLGAGCNIPKTTGLAEGVSMGVVVKHPTICAADVAKSDCERYDRERHPVAIETPPIHPAILGLLLPWKDGLVFKIGSLGWKNFGAFIGISRDRTHYCNRIDIDRDGNPVIHYRIQDIDVPNLIAGLEANLRMLRAAGGKVLFYAHSTAPWYVPSKPGNDDEEFEAYIQQMKDDGLKPLEMQIFSAHQMSSCRMAASPDGGPVSGKGELFECENVFIADGSVLPTSLGINPMITIDAMAHMISKNIIRRLRRICAVGDDN